jgi:uncharacterized protein YjcR
VLDAAVFDRRSETNAYQEKKRGGQPGNQNAVTHGRFSAPVLTARQAAWDEQQRRSDEWIKTVPKTDYDAIVEGLRVLRRGRMGNDGE